MNKPEVTEAPERIWCRPIRSWVAKQDPVRNVPLAFGIGEADPLYDGPEYVRADLFAAAEAEQDKHAAALEWIQAQAWAAINPANWQRGDTPENRIAHYEATLSEIHEHGGDLTILEQTYSEGYKMGAAEAEAERDDALDMVASLRDALEDCALSLEAEVNHQYRLPDGTIHPAQQRSFDGDMDDVRKGKMVLSDTANVARAHDTEVAIRAMTKCAEIADEIGGRDIFEDRRGFCRATSKDIAANIRAEISRLRDAKEGE